MHVADSGGAAAPELRMPTEWRTALRLLLVTDSSGDAARIEALVRAAVAGGVRAVQLREPTLPALSLAELCDRLRPVLEVVDGLLLVNDRADVVAAGHAHGVHLGHRSLPPSAVRPLLRPGQLLSVAVHDQPELHAAAAARVDFALLAPILPTSSKPGAPYLGWQVARALTRGSTVPLLWLGGLHAGVVAELAKATLHDRPLGIAVRSALAAAPDPK